uniref:3-oxoacyl-[acyl-carrier-protein] synthase II n=1 Tax=Candidatus Kentrum sp. UNK TaxID=2126344 RepID=A0A451AAU9_9GAMM|nr:MAG: 3-oxoacyl-[acyl-carrier-protein] synthase II [Candidatus Kentron sp. UNK]VFK71379.1 MAG: 3-oxoacyl-[acyl-carrier-protein] synthase II [Candidatus Kentron sp. UNK]
MSVMFKDGIWITGVGVVSALGNDFDSFSAGLRRGEDAARPISDFDASAVPGRLGCEVAAFNPKEHFPPRELRRMDRGSCLLVVAAREAMDCAGLRAGGYDPERCAVSLGSLLGGMRGATHYYEHLRTTGKAYATRLIDNPLYAAGARVCAEFGFLGPNLVFSTACSSGNVAIGTGADMIRLDDADMVLVGGFDTMAKMTVAGFNVLRNASPERCRPFDKKRQGLVLGEGAAVLILERADKARQRGARPLAWFLGHGMSSDAYHMTAPDVTGRGPAQAMESALRDADIDIGQIDYINAHGSGTPHNDAAETKAIRRVFGTHADNLMVSSTKSMHGHTLGAAGAVEAVAVIAGMRDGFVPPTANYRELDPKCNLDCVPNAARDQRIRVAMSNSFGFGGNNCAILLENAKDDD